MAIVTFYCGDPKNAPKTTQGAHLGGNAILLYQQKLLLERRVDADVWGLPGGGAKKQETARQAVCREIYEELGVRIPAQRFRKLRVYGDPGRIAAYRDGSVWRMVIVVYGYVFEQEPELRISRESRELRFFTREEVKTLPLAVTHRDIIEDLFLNMTENQWPMQGY